MTGKEMKIEIIIQMIIKEDIVEFEPTEHVNKMDLPKIQKETKADQNDPKTKNKMKYDWLPFYNCEVRGLSPAV